MRGPQLDDRVIYNGRHGTVTDVWTSNGTRWVTVVFETPHGEKKTALTTESVNVSVV